MRTMLLGVVLAVIALAGCAAPQRTFESHCVLQVTVQDEGMTEKDALGPPLRSVHVEARLLQTTAEVQGDLPDSPAWHRGKTTVSAPSMTLAVGEEGNLVITDTAPPVFRVVETGSRTFAVARVHDDVIWLRAVVKDFDEATRTGHVSFEVATQANGRIDAYFKAENCEFRDGETLTFKPTSPEWPEEGPAPPGTT